MCIFKSSKLSYYFVGVHDVGGTVLVRGVERSTERSAAERATPDAADERLRHALLHPATGLRTAACEFHCS